MKVLFLGEGRHDIGAEGDTRNDPQPAGGVATALARRICPNTFDPSSIGVRWKDLSRWNPAGKKGYEGKVKAALLLARQRWGCGGMVGVLDSDQAPHDAAEQVDRARAFDTSLPFAFAMVRKSIEAWTLGSPTALAEELGINPSKLPYKPATVESFSNTSDKPDRNSKAILAAVAKLGHETDSTELRVRVADRTDLAELRRNCPEGFKKFEDDVRLRFCSSRV